MHFSSHLPRHPQLAVICLHHSTEMLPEKISMDPHMAESKECFSAFRLLGLLAILSTVDKTFPFFWLLGHTLSCFFSNHLSLP